MAFVLSSVSGNLISAASAGYAPTNSADVSAIASAYQVVSATATQLYAGTSYLTGVNSAPISAERAGNAANASLATSAWYDGTGRFISALPDSAAVSSIASSYAESAVSSKQDTLSFAYNTADQISSINGSALGGMDDAAVSSIASAYAEAAASSKLDTSAFNSGDFYSTSNPSGFITGVDLSNYATTGYVDSSVSSKLDSTAFNSADFYSTANPSGFITGVDLSPYQTTADMSGYIPTSMSSDFQQVTGMSSYVPYSSIGYNTASAISGINGSALAGTTYSAGTGIDITDDVISVETPVDIVAGPGIVIDNPDGNTLRVSMAQDVENVLFDSAIPSLNNTMTLSESMFNFEYVEVYFYNPTTGDNPICYRYPTALLNTSKIAFKVGWAVNYMTEAWLKFTPTNDVKVWTYVNNTVIQYRHNTTTLTIFQDDSTYLKSPAKLRVVGIHRIAGGN